MTDKKPMPTVYTIREVAEILNCTYRTVQNYIYTGKIPAAKIGGRWRITEENLKKLLNGEIQTVGK